MSTPFAPLMEVSSRGEEMAILAASSALFLPGAAPIVAEIAREMEGLCTYHFNSPQELEKMLFEDLTAMV